MELRETVIPWRLPHKDGEPVEGKDFITIDDQGNLGANHLKHNTIGYAYRSDLVHYPNNPKEVRPKGT